MSEENKNLKNCKTCGKEIAKNAKACPHCGGKIKKPFYKKGWFIILALIVVIGVIASSGGDSEQTTTENTAVEQTQIEYTSYNVSELVDDLESNALNAETKYNKQYVEITGKLTTIDSKGAYISLTPADELFSIISVQCYIKNDEQKAKVAQLSTDDIVTVRGKIKSVGEVLGYSLDIDSIN